jgi:hypothetical protein
VTVRPFPQISRKPGLEPIVSSHGDRKTFVLGPSKTAPGKPSILDCRANRVPANEFEEVSIQGMQSSLDGELLESFERDRQTTTKTRKKL